MGRFLLSIWRDIMSNKIFTAILFIEILALILVSAYVMQNTDINNELVNKYDKEYNESIIVHEDKIKDYLGKEGFQNYAISESKSTASGTSVSVINKKASEILKVNHSGNWFGKAGAVDGVEALVAKSLRDTYEKGKTYTVEYSDGSSVNMYVIGYLAEENTVINIADNFYENLFGYAEIMLCDEISLDTFSGNTAILLDGKNPQYYLDNYNLLGGYNYYAYYWRDNVQFAIYDGEDHKGKCIEVYRRAESQEYCCRRDNKVRLTVLNTVYNRLYCRGSNRSIE